MKLFETFAGIVISAQFSATAQNVRSLADRDFALGEVAGHCLLVKCLVFRGVLLDDSPKSGVPVTVRVEEWLFGARAASDIMSVPYEDQFHNGDGLGGAHRAWMNVKVSRNTPVTVILGLERGLGVKPGEPVLVTSDQREASLIRDLTHEAIRLQRSENLLPDAVASLSRNPNAALAGYLFAHLILSQTITQRGLAWQLLYQMLGNPGVPPERWQGIPFFLLLYSGSVSEEQRATMIPRFAELAQQQDMNAARAGFEGLVLAANSGDSLRDAIPPTAIERLASAYRALVEKRLISRSQMLESRLSIIDK